MNEQLDWNEIKDRLEKVFRSAGCWDEAKSKPKGQTVEKRTNTWILNQNPDDLLKDGLRGREHVNRKTLGRFWAGKDPELSNETLKILAGTFEIPLNQLKFGGGGPGAFDHIDLVQHAIDAKSDTNDFLRRLRLDVDSSQHGGALKRLLQALDEAYRVRQLYFTPPTNRELAARLREMCFPKAKAGSLDKEKNINLDVVNVSDWNQTNSAFPLIDRAAFVLFDFVRRQLHESSDTEKSIGIGVGSGGTVRAVMQQFFRRGGWMDEIVDQLDKRKIILDFYPMAASVDTPHEFDDVPSKFLQLALSENGRDEWSSRIHATPHHRNECRNLKWMNKNIDAVITSNADVDDEHCMLKIHAEKHDATHLLSGAVGELQFRPYSETEFIKPTANDIDKFPTTLCEMETLAKFSNEPNKLVLLVVGKCLKHGCHRFKDKALRPLLTVNELRVFNHAVIDSTTTQRLLDPQK